MSTETKQTIKRIGQCKRCGRCCDIHNVFRHVFVNLSEDETKATLDKLKHGQRYCPNLRWRKVQGRGPGRKWKKIKYAICGIYGQRPAFCKAHPAIPADIVSKRCGYSFVEVDPRKD
jgi:Fe-S-cluster containining protein